VKDIYGGSCTMMSFIICTDPQISLGRWGMWHAWKEIGWGVWSGFNWLRIGASGRLL
jgi:hypothetical protein